MSRIHFRSSDRCQLLFAWQVRYAVLSFLVMGCAISSPGQTRTWNVVSGDWATGTNWNPNGVPADGEAVIITTASARVMLTNATLALSSLLLSNSATLVFSNWDTTLSATNVVIATNATMTCAAAFATNAMSNRVSIVCSNLTIDPGGKINVTTNGYLAEQGPGAGKTAQGVRGSGGGYGGKGGDCSYGTVGGAVYGSLTAPMDPGSGGGYGLVGGNGGPGGGAVRIDASGQVTINGTITANGADSGPWSGGASGGAIFINCDSFWGSGSLSANAGNAYGDGNGSGGGGRIAVIYNAVSQTGRPSVRFSAAPGTWEDPDIRSAGQMGTLYFTNTLFLSETLTNQQFMNVRLFVPGFTNWAPNSLTLSNCALAFGTNDFQLTVTNNLYIYNGGLGLYGNSILNCGGNMTLTNGSWLSVYSGVTNSGGNDYGALVSVIGDVVITSNSWIYPYSETNNGGSPLFRMRNLTITTNSGFNANYRGYTVQKGPGKGGGPDRGSGAGYGGKGGRSSMASGGSTYRSVPTYGLGSSNAPIDPGSGGGFGWYIGGGPGGGLVRIEADNVTINGVITANGIGGGNYGGGSSGGGIFIMCTGSFGGSGTLRANGGDRSGTEETGGGGGGRIAIWYRVPGSERSRILAGDTNRITIANTYAGFSGSLSVTNGNSWSNTPPDCSFPGTIIFLRSIPPPGTVISIR